jgi:hypothetical protein
MMSHGATWNFLGVPRVISLVGDYYTMWAWRIEKLEIRNLGD